LSTVVHMSHVNGRGIAGAFYIIHVQRCIGDIGREVAIVIYLPACYKDLYTSFIYF